MSQGGAGCKNPLKASKCSTLLGLVPGEMRAGAKHILAKVPPIKSTEFNSQFPASCSPSCRRGCAWCRLPTHPEARPGDDSGPLHLQDANANNPDAIYGLSQGLVCGGAGLGPAGRSRDVVQKREARLCGRWDTCSGQGSRSDCLPRTDSETQIRWYKKINKQTTNIK